MDPATAGLAPTPGGTIGKVEVKWRPGKELAACHPDGRRGKVAPGGQHPPHRDSPAEAIKIPPGRVEGPTSTVWEAGSTRRRTALGRAVRPVGHGRLGRAVLPA